MSKIIACVNQKGGVGKTTTSVNLAYALAQMGKDVLVVDYDSQASLTNCLNVGLNGDDDYYGVYEMMVMQLRGLTEEECPELAKLDYKNIDDFCELCELCISRPTYIEVESQVVDGTRKLVEVSKEFGFDLLASHFVLSDYELEISSLKDIQRKGNVFRLSNVINRILSVHEYDYVIIDCNPSLGVMTMNAIAAAVDGVIIPTNMDLMSTRGVGNLINRIADIQQLLAEVSDNEVQHYGVIGIVLNLYADRRIVDKTIATDMERFYPFTIFKSTIPESVNAKKASFAGVLYSQLYKKAADAYLSLAKEIEKKTEDMRKKGPQIIRLGNTTIGTEGLAEGDEVDG